VVLVWGIYLFRYGRVFVNLKVPKVTDSRFKKICGMSDNSKFFAGLILGAAAGAAIAVLLNTDKGKELVADIKDAAGRAGEGLKEAAGRFQDELNQTMEKGRSFMDDLGKKTGEA
jgi:gas vesicle protein